MEPPSRIPGWRGCLQKAEVLDARASAERGGGAAAHSVRGPTPAAMPAIIRSMTYRATRHDGQTAGRRPMRPSPPIDNWRGPDAVFFPSTGKACGDNAGLRLRSSSREALVCAMFLLHSDRSPAAKLPVRALLRRIISLPLQRQGVPGPVESASAAVEMTFLTKDYFVRGVRPPLTRTLTTIARSGTAILFQSV